MPPVPGATVAPAWMVTVPAQRPVPARVAAAFAVTALAAASDPLTCKVPASTVVVPVYVLAAVNARVPAPVLMSGSPVAPE